MTRPYNYGSVPPNKYKGGMGSVAQFPLDPNQSAEDLANSIPLTPFANWANTYGGLNSFVDLNPRSPITSSGGNILVQPITITNIVTKYIWWIVGAIGVVALMNNRRR